MILLGFYVVVFVVWISFSFFRLVPCLYIFLAHCLPTPNQQTNPKNIHWQFFIPLFHSLSVSQGVVSCHSCHSLCLATKCDVYSLYLDLKEMPTLRQKPHLTQFALNQSAHKSCFVTLSLDRNESWSFWVLTLNIQTKAKKYLKKS